jgi:alpha-galactosidase
VAPFALPSPASLPPSSSPQGLKFGLYTCIGETTCRGGRPGSYGHYEEDARQLAAWGVDWVKADNCHRPSGFTAEQLYSNFSAALNATGRAMVFALCEWGNENVSAWGGSVGHSFRCVAPPLG